MKRHMKHLLDFLMLAFGLSFSGMADSGDNGYKLGGARVAKVVGIPGQWTYVVSADPSGRSASGHGSVDVGFTTSAILGGDYFEPVDSESPVLVNAIKTGPDTAS